MTKNDWKKLIKSLPPGLTAKEASKYLNLNYSTVRGWMLEFKYKFADGRSQAWPVKRRLSASMIDPRKVNWAWPNIRIAEHFGVSRERVRQLRGTYCK
jgi:transposase